VLAIDPVLQVSVLRGIDLVERRSNDRDRAAAVLDRCGVRGEVDSLREPGDHHDTCARAVPGELRRATAAFVSGLPRADDRDPRTLEQREIADAMDLWELEQESIGDPDALGLHRDHIAPGRRNVFAIVRRGHHQGRRSIASPSDIWA
jgi:hypothetical protein